MNNFELNSILITHSNTDYSQIGLLSKQLEHSNLPKRKIFAVNLIKRDDDDGQSHDTIGPTNRTNKIMLMQRANVA